MVDVREPRRGEVWWAASDKRRPVVVVQADFLNRSRTDWILAVPLTTNLARADAPGNVRLSRQDTGLPSASVANVAQVAPVHRSGLRDRVGAIPSNSAHQIDAGLRLVLSLGGAV